MADTDLPDAPWAPKPEPKEKGPSASGTLVDAPWVLRHPEAVVDIAKTAVPSVIRGSLAALTTPRALSDLTGQGVNYLANKFAPQSVADAANKFHNWDSGIGGAFPSYAQLHGETEAALGHPLYEAQTPAGKAVQTGLEVAPSLAAGGEGVVPTLGRSVGAGALSGLLGSGADYLKSKFPNLPDWVAPVARGTGAMVGAMGAPRAVTPLPMTDARLAEVNSLRATNPELVNASSAGQLTNSPRVMGLEARSPNMASVPDAQEQAYTQGVMRQIGADGHMFNDAGMAQAKAGGDTLRMLQNAHDMSAPEFALLNQDVARMGRPGSELFRAVGPSQAFKEAQDAIKLGPAAGKYGPPLNMTGERYGALKQILQNQGQGAPTTHEANAIFNARERMKQAFKNSVPSDVADELTNREQQYSNFKTVEGIKPKAGEETLTPSQVAPRADRGSPLKEHADQAARVMTPFPKPGEGGNTAPLIGSAIGGTAGLLWNLLHGGTNESAVLAILGGERAGNAIGAAKDIAGRVVGNPAVQSYAKNQYWRPQGLVTDAPNREALVKALMSSEATNSH